MFIATINNDQFMRLKCPAFSTSYSHHCHGNFSGLLFAPRPKIVFEWFPIRVPGIPGTIKVIWLPAFQVCKPLVSKFIVKPDLQDMWQTLWQRYPGIGKPVKIKDNTILTRLTPYYINYS